MKSVGKHSALHHASQPFSHVLTNPRLLYNCTYTGHLKKCGKKTWESAEILANSAEKCGNANLHIIIYY
jgi:hypothetical protein